MAQVSSIIAGIGLAFTAFGTVQEQRANKKRQNSLDASSEATRKANEERKRGSDLARARERRKAAKAAQRQVAEAKSAGSTSGAAPTSSNIQGAQGGIRNVAFANTLFSNQQQTLADNFGTFTNQAADFRTEANGFATDASNAGAIAGLGGTIFDNRNEIGALFA